MGNYSLAQSENAAAHNMEDYQAIYSYLESNEYPDSLTKDQKRNFRRKCNENFKIENGQLFHRKCYRQCANGQHQPNQLEDEWKFCLRTEEEKARVLRSCHSSAIGKYALA